MKVFIVLLVISLAALSLADFENDRPIEEIPGFFNGREHLKAKFNSASARGGRITNGAEATPGQFPYMAYLSIATTAGGFFCGASLINGFTALSAAHCVDDERLTSVVVVLGAHDITFVEPTQLRVTVLPPGVIIHPDYDWWTLENDLNLLRFPPIIFTPRIQPIRLPFGTELDHTFENEPSSLSGWGLTEQGVVSPVLRFIRHSIISNDACRIQWPDYIIETHICSSTIEGQSGCNGDSGGPLTVVRDGQSVQVGIVSWGTVDCMYGWPSVYARVTHFIEWIQNH